MRFENNKHFFLENMTWDDMRNCFFHHKAAEMPNLPTFLKDPKVFSLSLHPSCKGSARKGVEA